MSITRRRALVASAAVVASSSWTLAQAQPAGWPARPITLVVAYPAGGDTDALRAEIESQKRQRRGDRGATCLTHACSTRVAVLSGLVLDARRKISFLRSGAPVSTFRTPCASYQASLL